MSTSRFPIHAPGIWPEQAEQRSSLANPSPLLLESFGVTASLSGERVTVDKALELAAVRSAVAMISQAVGGLPLKVYRIFDDDHREEARTHRVWKLLHDKPNESCTARGFWTTTAAQLLIYENSLIYKERDEEDEVESLYHLDPTQVVIELTPQGKRFRIENPEARPVKGKRNYTEEEILHIVGFSLDGYFGRSRIMEAKQTLGIALARSRFEGQFYKSGAKVAGVLEHPGRLGEAGVKNIAEAFSKWHGGSANMHKVPVLEEGMAWKSVSSSLEDMQFAQMAEQTRTEIAVLFNIPPAYLGATTGDSLTYATTESNQIQFATMAVLPVADTIAKALSADPALLPWNVMFCEFVLEGLLRADMKTRAEYWEKLKAMDVVSAEYIASRENLPKPPKPKPVPAPLAPETKIGDAAVPFRPAGQKFATPIK